MFILLVCDKVVTRFDTYLLKSKKVESIRDRFCQAKNPTKRFERSTGSGPKNFRRLRE